MNKIYKLDGIMYQEPVSKDFDYENAVEITSPINDDGTVINSHPLAVNLDKKTDGKFFSKYSQAGIADVENEKIFLIDKLEKKIKIHFGTIIDEGFQIDEYWITCRKIDQSDLSSILKGLELSNETARPYRCYSFIENVKSNKKKYFSFNKELLESIFSTGFEFVLNNVAEESKMIESLEELTLEELENFEI